MSAKVATAATISLSPTQSSSSSSRNNNKSNKSLDETIPSIAVVATSDSSSVNHEQPLHPQHDDSLHQNTSFSLDDLSKLPRELARKIEWISRCNNPFEVLRSLGLHPGRENQQQQQQQSAVLDEDDYEQQMFGLEGEDDQELDNINPYVAFQFLQHCEYCGAASTDQCIPSKCSRPSTFFPKQRPPFCQPNSKRWNDDNDAMTKQTLYVHQRQPRRKRPPIQSSEEWKIVATPKVKNQWLTPTSVVIPKVASSSSSSSSLLPMDHPRLLCSNIEKNYDDFDEDDYTSIKWTSSGSRSGASTNASNQQHPSFFPVSTRDLRQRSQPSAPLPPLLADCKDF
jgi:hypothetical protein